jgi:outer membrane lipoprotein-sorting protein
LPTDLASELLEQTREATAELHTLRADVEGVFGSEDFTGNVVLQRPNLARVEIKGGTDFGEYRIFSDGQNYVVYFPADNRYVRSRSDPEGRQIQAFVAAQVEYFFQPHSIGVLPAGASAHYIGRETIGSSIYEVVEIEVSSPRKNITRYFISPNDNLIHQVVTVMERADGTTATTWVTLKNVRLNEPVDETTFQWIPPPTAGPLQLPSGIPLPVGEGTHAEDVVATRRPSDGVQE